MDEMLKDELKRLRDYSVTPDERLWSSIMTTVQSQNRSAALKRRTRKGWMLLTVIVLLGGLFVLDQSPVTLTQHIAPVSTQRPETGALPYDSPNDVSDEREPYEDHQASLKLKEEKLYGRSKVPSSKVPIEHGKERAQSHRNAEASGRISEPGSRTQSTSGNLSSSTKALGSPRALSNSGFQNGHVSTTLLSTDGQEKSAHDLAARDPSAATQPGAGNSQVLVDPINTTEASMDAPKADKVSASTVQESKGSTTMEQPIVVKQQKRKRNFSLYFTIMPTLGYQRIEANDHDNLIVESIHKVAAFSPERLGVRAETGVEIPVYRKLNFFSGLVYYQREQTVGYVEKQVEYVEVVNGGNGQIITKPQFVYLDKSFEYQVKNVGLQVGVNYQLKSAAMLQTVGTGLEFHVALNRKSQPNPNFTNNPSVYVFYNLYYRLEYPADTKLRAVFQPTLNYSFYISKDMNAPFYVKPYGLGLNLGATYHF